MRVLLVGNPNTGKTTLFNCLTGAHEKTANWTGVTVSQKSRRVVFGDKEFEFVDLPGLYSMNISGEDELVARQKLINSKNALILFVATIDSLERNLFLCHELFTQGYRIVLVVNTFGKKENVDFLRFQKETGIEVVKVDAKNCKEKVLSFLSKPQSVANKSELKTYNDFFSLIDYKSQRQLTVADRLLLGNITGPLLILLAFALSLWLAFGTVGALFAEWVEVGVVELGRQCSLFLIEKDLIILENFVSLVLVDAVGSVFAFLPQLTILLLTVSVMEEMGVLSRMAYHLNPCLAKVGMSGKSIFSLLTGFGCTTSAVMVSRGVESREIKNNTVRFLPFIGCSAKLPIALFLATFVVGSYGVYVVVGTFALAVMLGIFVLNSHNKKDDEFIVELPALRLPSLKTVFYNIGTILAEFVRRVFTVIFLVSLVVWVLQSVNTNFEFELNSDSSLLYAILSEFEFVLKPLGFGSWKVLFALLLGLLAKENIVAGLVMLGGLQELVTIEQTISLVLFIFMYSPCLPALISIRKEFGKGAGMRMFLFQTTMAYLSSFVFFTFASLFGLVVGVVLLICFAVLCALFVKQMKFGLDLFSGRSCVDCGKRCKEKL